MLLLSLQTSSYMEFKFRSVDERPPPPASSTLTAFFSASSQRAFRAQTVTPPITSALSAISTQPNILPPPPLPPPSFRNHSDIRLLTPDPLHNPRSFRDAMIDRQLEKDRIRDEILAAEIVRRRILEAEVRRELMFERDFAMRRAAANPTTEVGAGGGSGALAFDHQDRFGLMRFDPMARLPPYSFDADRFTFSRMPAAFPPFLSPPQLPEPMHNNFKPPQSSSEHSSNKDKLIILAKPDPNLSGVKLKTPPTAGASELPPFGLRKKPKEEWSCALCQVSATSEKGLNQHINGKKHKVKEAGLRALKLSKSSSTTPSSKKTAKLSGAKDTTGIRNSKLEAKQVKESLDHSETSDGGLDKKMQDTGSLNDKKEELPLWNDQCGKGLKNKDKRKIVDGWESKEDVKKQKKFNFWCERCKVGAYSPKVMSAHMSGKKHLARCQELTEKNDPIASSMASSEASKEAEVADAAKEALEKILTLTANASSGDNEKAEDADLAKEAKNTAEMVVADSAKEADNKVPTATDISPFYMMANNVPTASSLAS